MATEPLFYTDSYLRDFQAVVIAVRPDGVTLDRTAFYPRGGGQPSDTGELCAHGQVWPVTAVRRQGGDIVHRLEGEPPPAGTAVTGHLDWDLRFAFMRLHTALHALSGVVWTGWQADVTGSHIYDDGAKARMDFSLEGVRINDVRDEIEERLKTELAAARPVRAYELPRAEALELPDLIRTHVNLVPAHIPNIRHRGNRGTGPPGRRRHARRQHQRNRPGGHRQRRQQGAHQPPPRDRPYGLTS